MTTTVSTTARDRALISGGIVAGPLFLAVTVAQVLTRDGFDLSRHPASLLSNGDLGFVQIANFVVSGLLYVAAAIGLRNTGSTWIPRLVAIVGIGLIVAGVFRADPSMGFPIGAPEGQPDDISLAGSLHGVGFALTFLSIVAVNIVVARQASKEGDKRRAQAHSVAAIASVVLPAIAVATTIGHLFLLAAAVGLLSLTAIAVRTRSYLI